MKLLKFTLLVGASFVSQFCAKSKFSSRKAEPAASTPQPGKLPNEADANSNKLCADKYKASRIAFIVDNSESHGLPSGSVQQLGAGLGSDPVYRTNSRDGLIEPLTNRQLALYNTIVYTSELDAKAVASNPQFVGSEIGLAYFPLSNDYDGLSKYKMVSGSGQLSRPMTNMKNIKLDGAGKDQLWNTLSFTHKPLGMTPYTTGLNAAYDLLKVGRDPTDNRPDLVIFITDGLPTDEQPSKVREARRRLENTRVIVISVLKPGTDINSNNSVAKASLKAAFENDQPEYRWARKPGATDGYLIGDYEKYWADLLALPKTIADQYIEIVGSPNINTELSRILEAERTCK